MKKIYLALVAMMFAITSFGKSLNADFTTGNGGAVSWDSATETLTWTAPWDNWINAFTFGTTGNLKDYQAIKFTVSDLTGMYRIIFKGAGDANIAIYGDLEITGDVTVNFAENSQFKNVDLSTVERILIAGHSASGSMTLKNVVLESSDEVEPEPEPAQDLIEFDIDKSMFKGWDKADETAVVTNENPWWDGGLGVEKSNGAVLFGNGNVNWNEYADLSGYEKIVIYGTGGNVRVMFNRAEDPNNKGALTEINIAPTPEGTEINVAEKFASSAFVHLNCIKVGWGQTATVSRIVLTKVDVKPLKDVIMEDIPQTSPAKTFSTGIKGAASLKVNPNTEIAKVAKITKFDGTKVATATIIINSAGKVAMTTEDVLPNGDYYVTIAENVFKINDQIYDRPLSCILAVGERDALAEEAYGALQSEIEEATEIKDELIYGVNVFQYSPGLKKKIQAAIDEAVYNGDLLVEEEHIYNVISDLRKYMKSIRPNLPKADSKYAFKHKESGLYLNIDGDKVTLQKEPYPIQFHLVEASEGPWCQEEGDWDEYDWTKHYTYIYATPDRKYLGYNREEKEEEFDGEKYTYYAPVLTNKKNTVWWVGTEKYNEYYIEIAGWYEGYTNGLIAKEAKEGSEVIIDVEGEDEYVWFIEEYVAPETPDTPETPETPDTPDTPDTPAVDASLIEIAQSQGKDLDTFERTPLVEGEEYNTYTASKDLQIAIKMVNVDVAKCDYVVIKFAEPVAAGWKLAFWSGQDLVDVPEGATEYKYVFADDDKCGVVDGVLPQICMMTFFGGYTAPLTAKVTGIYKHIADAENASGSDDTTAINSVSVSADAAAIYNAAGARTNTLGKGVNIVKLANGQVKKVFIK